MVLNSSPVYVPFLYPQKISENQLFSDFFRGYRNGTLTCNGFIFHYNGSNGGHLSKKLNMGGEGGGGTWGARFKGNLKF